MFERHNLRFSSLVALTALLSFVATGCSQETSSQEDVGSSAAALTSWDTFFSDTNGWNSPQYYTTIRLADVSSDGRADVCGRSSLGINCGLSTGSSFSSPTLWGSAFSDAGGWGTAPYYSTIRFPNVNGSGGKDVCGRGSGGINCALSSGSAFGSTTVWSSAFSDAGGWNLEKYYATIDFPDVNADGKADVCGRGSLGINCALSNGSAFGAASLWTNDFSDAGGWADPKYYRTIRYPDLNADGRQDVCVRGSTGVLCSLSTGAAFGSATLWSSFFSDTGGWGDVKYYSTIAFPDINGDGKADVCGRASTGMTCALSNGSSFGTTTLWEGTFTDGGGWGSEPYYSTIAFPDLNQDGKADLCARGVAGLYCGFSNGSVFTPVGLIDGNLADSGGWNQPQYYKTLRYDNIDSDSTPELCGRGGTGMFCLNFF